MQLTFRQLAVVVMGLGLSLASLGDEPGKQDYLAYCSSCHGLDGKGKGPMHLSTTTPPSDLTLLSQNNGSNFPYLKIRKVIDGRIEKGNNSGAHMKGGMPVWGDVFTAGKSNTAAGDIHIEAQAKMRILNIVDYLASIQEQCVGECQ